MDFEVVGTHQKFSLPCKGICELPRLNADSRNVFMRRVKGINASGQLPNKRFVIHENFYSFGPLSLFKRPEWKKELTEDSPEQDRIKLSDIESTNMDIVRVTNSGRYKCTVDIGLLDPSSNGEPITEDASPNSGEDVFLIEPKVVELEEGETKEVKVWAMPRDVREYSNALVMCVHDQPAPVSFPIKCWGVKPTLDIEGPWGDAIEKAEKALAENTDKKLTKDLETTLAALKESFTLDFERILIGKSDTRQFMVKNTCLLPVEFEMDAGDFADSPNVTIEPMSGTIPINTSQPITVTFTSPEALMLEGKFSLRYSDHEGGLRADSSDADNEGRVVTTNFRAVAEAYQITAVSLNSEGAEEGGSEIDFGLVRVGDYAVQSMKMGNKGKYRIGYSFKITPATANLIKIEPMEGIIETGTDLAEIKVTFCSKQNEVLLRNNKDVIVQILEPLTGEVVEKFPLYISGQAKYNKFRLQPSKGISFGAIRFDAPAKSKSVELRNEGNFEVTYVVCPASTEHEELDTLDAPAFAAYAYATPAALREDELGSQYKERIAGGGGNSSGAKKGKDKAPAKGKGAAVEEPSSTLNPLVLDPDELVEPPLPDDPMTVGAFTVSPRIGRVQPGQSVSIFMDFDPSGCATVKERMRICISGADPKDSLTKVVRTFELAGESCVPAIVTDDVFSIFEEQEIVHSLSESTGDKESEGGGKLEKLAVGKVVYAEAEKMLAFGPVSCGSSSGRGVVERVRISNPTKIDIKVKFGVLSPEQAAAMSSGGSTSVAGGKDAKGGKAAPKGKGGKGAPASEDSAAIPSVFTVQPERWEIPPHEHRYVNVYFNPTEIKSYRSVFHALIDDDGIETSAEAKVAKSGKSLMFDLGGSGTLPCIAFDQPSELTDGGNLLIDFQRILVDRSRRRKLVIRNDGVMPATCLFDIVGDDDFIFPAKGTSLTVNPSEKEELLVSFAPKGDSGSRSAKINVSVLNNQFDAYTIELTGTTYSCDAAIKTNIDGEARVENDENADGITSSDMVVFSDINLSDGPGESSQTIQLNSTSKYPLKFTLSPAEEVPKVLKFSPSTGHLGPNGTREIVVTFAATEQVQLESSLVNCKLERIKYPEPLNVPPESTSDGNEVAAAKTQALAEKIESERALWGSWDDSMKSVRPAQPEDIAAIEVAATALKDYEEKAAAEKAKGKKGKPVGPPPERCLLELGPVGDDGSQVVYEIVAEPSYEVIADGDGSTESGQNLDILCNGVADFGKYSCQSESTNLTFVPTFLFQTTVHNFTFKNESNIKLPIKWNFDNLKARRNMLSRAQSRTGSALATTHNTLPPPEIPCPFSIEPQECEVAPNSSKEFELKFLPLEVDDFLYALKGETITTIATTEGEAAVNAENMDFTLPNNNGTTLRMVLRGTAKRPICHFDIKETTDYMSRRPLNMKNENGLNSPIEVTDIKVVELESVGLKTRNTFRFYITNPTSDNYEFIWETMGDASPFWRCVQGAGMMYAGKRIEMVFEYLPDEVHVAEAFFKFRIPKVGLEQMFLFTGKVAEPKVLFSSSKIDFHSVMLGGEGSSETIYLENKEHLPFNFAIDKYSLMQLEGPNGPVLDISPKEGSVAPYSKIPIHLHFQPQEEIVCNFNILCVVKRKPNKLSLNVKGEGYAVHPFIQMEQTDVNGLNHYMTLKPAPAVNFSDFGAVQVLDTIAKTITVTNNGKFNFDYIWDIDNISPMLTLSGGKMGGTLLKADEISYKLTFAPQREGTLDGSMLSFTVAGKYTYNILPRGSGVKPALRFSTLHHDFGPCFITSPGGSTVIEEMVLHIVNHDPMSNISIECTFQKIRALWAECAPTVIPPGGQLDVPIRFAPREVKDYAFVVPFVVNGTSKVPVNITGSGISARMELVNGSQRRTNFGLVNVGSEVTRIVNVLNKSKRALPVQLIESTEYGSGALTDRCVEFAPTEEVLVEPRQTQAIQLKFNPNKRVPQFNEDLMVRYAGVTRKLLTVSGKAQGTEISLDSDSLPFGVVVLDSQKVRKLTLENTGDLTITFNWMATTFGPHFSIQPLSGKILPGDEVAFDVTFKPTHADDDIRQDDMMLMIPGLDPLKLTCTGSCIPPPTENIQTLEFNSLARKAQVKDVTVENPSDRDWYLAPSLEGVDWKVPHEFKVPAKGKADLQVTYYPLTMSNKVGQQESDTPEETGESAHSGQLFIALPDGSAKLYKLRGEAGPPECSGELSVDTPAKTAATVVLRVENWLGETQRLDVAVNISEKPTPATFIVAANATEIGPNGTKEFPVRFVSYTEGTSKGTVTFTNPVTGEYCFFEIAARTTMAEVQETISIESPVRQTARHIITVENPLPPDSVVSMGSIQKPEEWWSCDSSYVKLNELSELSGNHEGTFEVEYRPLTPTSQPTEHLLTIMTKELGTFKYKVVLKATPPLLKQLLRFDAPLGSMQSETFIFHAFNQIKCDYSCSVTKPSFFTVQPSLPVDAVPSGWDGDDIRLPVLFEPLEIGEVKDTLTVKSAEGGEYLCELVGNCVAPMPQGPYNLQQGAGAVEIPFRNCFAETATWTFSVDSAAFRIAAPTGAAQVNAKTQSQCSVIFEPNEEHVQRGGVINAKLFITCSSKPEIPPWIFYLRGAVNPDAPAAATGKKK